MLPAQVTGDVICNKSEQSALPAPLPGHAKATDPHKQPAQGRRAANFSGAVQPPLRVAHPARKSALRARPLPAPGPNRSQHQSPSCALNCCSALAKCGTQITAIYACPDDRWMRAAKYSESAGAAGTAAAVQSILTVRNTRRRSDTTRACPASHQARSPSPSVTNRAPSTSTRARQGGSGHEPNPPTYLVCAHLSVLRTLSLRPTGPGTRCSTSDGERL